MPADLSDFDAAVRNGGQPLRVDTILEQLEDSQRESLLTALRMPDKYPAPAVARAVKKWGPTVSECAVRNWRERNV